MTVKRPYNVAIFQHSFPYFQLSPMFTLNCLLSCFFSLVEIAKKVESVVVIGGGFLGSELACALAAWTPDAKLQVTQIFPEHGNMAKVNRNKVLFDPVLKFSLSAFLQNFLPLSVLRLPG